MLTAITGSQIILTAWPGVMDAVNRYRSMVCSSRGPGPHACYIVFLHKLGLASTTMCGFRDEMNSRRGVVTPPHLLGQPAWVPVDRGSSASAPIPRFTPWGAQWIVWGDTRGSHGMGKGGDLPCTVAEMRHLFFEYSHMYFLATAEQHILHYGVTLQGENKRAPWRAGHLGQNQESYHHESICAPPRGSNYAWLGPRCLIGPTIKSYLFFSHPPRPLLRQVTQTLRSAPDENCLFLFFYKVLLFWGGPGGSANTQHKKKKGLEISLDTRPHFPPPSPARCRQPQETPVDV